MVGASLKLYGPLYMLYMYNVILYIVTYTMESTRYHVYWYY